MKKLGSSSTHIFDYWTHTGAAPLVWRGEWPPVICKKKKKRKNKEERRKKSRKNEEKNNKKITKMTWMQFIKGSKLMSFWGGNPPHPNFSEFRSLTNATIRVNALTSPLPMKIPWCRPWLKHPFSLTPSDIHLNSLCSKFQLTLILCWWDMRDNINYTSPLNTVL